MSFAGTPVQAGTKFAEARPGNRSRVIQLCNQSTSHTQKSKIPKAP